MDDRSWLRLGRASAILNGLFYLGGAIFIALINFDVLVKAPDFGSGLSTYKRDVIFFGYVRERWPFDFSASLLFGAGFLFLIPIGMTLAHILRERPAAGSLMSAGLMLAGIAGVSSQLLYVGARRAILDLSNAMANDCCKEVLTNLGSTNYIWEKATTTLINGVFLGAGIGIVAAAMVVRATRPGSTAWASFSYLVAAVYFIGFLGDMFGVDLIIDYAPLIGGGILAPIWAFWLARELPRLTRETASQLTP